jgi:hypothetical protein
MDPKHLDSGGCFFLPGIQRRKFVPFSMSIDAYYHAASHVLPLCSCFSE